MPRGDRTGPMGMGAMTGRGAGFCAGYAMPGFMNPAAGRGWGMGYGRGGGRGFGRGMGQGRGWMYTAAQYAAPIPYSPQDEVGELKDQAKYLSEALESITSRIAELEKAKK